VTVLDVQASLAALGRQNREGQPVKIWEDLDRYERVLAQTKPEVLVECGTYAGDFARWVARHGVDVVTIDIAPQDVPRPGDERITWLTANTTSSWVIGQVSRLVAGRRTMVVLDSNHSVDHVSLEIKHYGPLVTPGCYLVVEDGIVAWYDDGVSVGSPLKAIEELLGSSPVWERDLDIEALHSVSMNPSGWLRRRE
jgi:cephalosporin hydroxylase